MTHSSQITIGPEFFQKAKNDYNDFYWALVREFVQNCVDCGSSNIGIEVVEYGDNTLMVVKNDGDPMTKEILTDKLLSLGSSGKEDRDVGSVGGFGKAKEILYFMHREYKIETGNYIVVGCGAGYSLGVSKSSVSGTRSTIIVEGDHVSELKDAVYKFCSFLQWNGVLSLNGEGIKTSLRKGSPRVEKSFGKVYTNRSFSHKLVVRMSGVPMYTDFITYDGCVVVELSSDSLNCLTSNRDSLKQGYRASLNEFVGQLSIDNRSAFRNVNPTYIHYRGNQVTGHQKTTPTGSVNNDDEEHKLKKFKVAVVKTSTFSEEKPPLDDNRTDGESSLEFEFVVKNETSLVIPDHFLMENMSKYSRSLANNWTRVLVELHRLFEVDGSFKVGFVFSEDCEAQFDNGMYLLNPAKIVEQKMSRSRSFSKMWKLTEKDRLIMVALHEFIHGIGHVYHDETYSSLLTDMAAIVMENRKRFAWCFK